MTVFEETMHARQDFANIVVAAAFSIPLALPPAFGYETNPAFLLAPFMAFTVLRHWKNSAAGLFFILSGIGGFASIATAGYLYPDGRLLTNFLSLLLIMFSAGFYFLGRSLDGDRLFRWTAFLSIAFVIMAAAHPVALGQYVRWYIPPKGLAFLNVEFFGLPVFASFGVNALAHLICIQAALICGLAFDRNLRSLQTIACLIGFAASSFLIIGSDSRSSQIFLTILGAAILLYAIRHRAAWKTAAALIFVGAIAGGAGSQYAPELRLSGSAASMVEMATGETANGPRLPGMTTEARVTMDTVSTGRAALVKAAIEEIKQSPWIGSGFSPFGRYAPVDAELHGNSGTHIYYMTVLWKGGLIYAVPLFGFLAVAALLMLRRAAWRETSLSAFATVAVIMMFGFLALTYDTPAVPSAGALAFLLLGALGQDKRTKPL